MEIGGNVAGTASRVRGRNPAQSRSVACGGDCVSRQNACWIDPGRDGEALGVKAGLYLGVGIGLCQSDHLYARGAGGSHRETPGTQYSLGSFVAWWRISNGFCPQDLNSAGYRVALVVPRGFMRCWWRCGATTRGVHASGTEGEVSPRFLLLYYSKNLTSQSRGAPPTLRRDAPLPMRAK